jgi:inosine/xanthosine triphosphate pyrophosphatase family protein
MMASHANRTASAVTIVGAYDGHLRTFPGTVRGTIAMEPAGTGG